MSVTLLVGLGNDPIATRRQAQSRPIQRQGTAVSIRGSCALTAAEAHVRKSVSRMCLAVCKLSAARVSVGLAVAPVGNVLLPTR